MSNSHYLAGLIDGEGTIGLERQNATRVFRTPYISLSSTTMAIHMWLQENYGGSLSTHKVYKEGHKPSWVWRLKNLQSINSVLTEIEPLLLEPEKRRRAQLILWEYPAVTIRNGKYNDEQRLEKMKFEENFFNPDYRLTTF